MMSEGGGEGVGPGEGSGCPPTTQTVWLPHHQAEEDDDEEEERGGGGGEVVVVGGAGTTTLYSREDGATVLEAPDGTTTVLRPATPSLTVTVEGTAPDTDEGESAVRAIVDGRAGLATLVEGAEVVRTQAVSYATPILHHVFLQAAPTTTTTSAIPRRPHPTPILLQAARTTRPAAIKEDSSKVVGRVTLCSTSSSPSPASPTSSCTTTTTTTSCGSPSSLHHHHHHHQSTSPPCLSPSPASSPAPPAAASSPRHNSSAMGLGSSSSSSSSSSGSAATGARGDDELTSLSWLQDSNLLRGTALSPVKPGQGDVVKAASPTSDYGDESSDALEPGELTLNDQPHTQPSRSQPIPYNPQVHVNAKPPYSFSCLIFMAIEDSVNKALPVKDIYAWILDHFPYFRNAPTGWKNSVRHNLSLNKCFRKVEKAPNLGKGSLWMVDPAYRPNLLQSLSKTPFHPYSNLDRIYMVSTKYAFNRQPGEVVGGPLGTVTRTPPVVDAPPASPPKPSGATNNVPDPELFPYLARRLGGVGGTGAGGGVQSEDVDAAAAMLALKHGAHMVTPASESYSKLRDGKDTSVLYNENKKRKRKRKFNETGCAPQVGSARMMVISSSPSQDHSYTSVDGEEEGGLPAPGPPAPPKASPNHHPSPPKKANHSPTSSVDEAFSDDSYDSDVASEASQADMRQLVEGADALLNLAAVATSLASQRQNAFVHGRPLTQEASNRSYRTHTTQEANSRSHRNQEANSRSHRPNTTQETNSRSHRTHTTSHLGRVHILKPSHSKVSASKGNISSGSRGSKGKGEVAHNNNTIMNNNNKVLKVKMFGGSHSRGSHKHRLSTSQ